ncbi:hypothetical protein HU200_005196 [Digitaria exilis]|uniref:Uncharacterized protein n=1 Tax=Digitaria exilis TaxID=1010633 RepID=A0A835FS47_9POAL|nr:hypothetical protein HU200_005196 [Digitaria exilis]
MYLCQSSKEAPVPPWYHWYTPDCSGLLLALLLVSALVTSTVGQFVRQMQHRRSCRKKRILGPGADWDSESWYAYRLQIEQESVSDFAAASDPVDVDAEADAGLCTWTRPPSLLPTPLDASAFRDARRRRRWLHVDAEADAPALPSAVCIAGPGQLRYRTPSTRPGRRRLCPTSCFLEAATDHSDLRFNAGCCDDDYAVDELMWGLKNLAYDLVFEERDNLTPGYHLSPPEGLKKCIRTFNIEIPPEAVRTELSIDKEFVINAGGLYQCNAMLRTTGEDLREEFDEETVKKLQAADAAAGEAREKLGYEIYHFMYASFINLRCHPRIIRDAKDRSGDCGEGRRSPWPRPRKTTTTRPRSRQPRHPRSTDVSGEPVLCCTPDMGKLGVCTEGGSSDVPRVERHQLAQGALGVLLPPGHPRDNVPRRDRRRVAHWQPSGRTAVAFAALGAYWFVVSPQSGATLCFDLAEFNESSVSMLTRGGVGGGGWGVHHRCVPQHCCY